MKKIISLSLFQNWIRLVLAAFLFFCFSGCGGGSDKRLTLYTWEGMFPAEIMRSFEKETGYRINYVNFDSNETMLSKLEAANGGGYDLVIADDYIVEAVITGGLAQKLDKNQIPNYPNINPMYLLPFYDPQGEYTVPYGAGVQTIVYDPSRAGVEINGFADLWNSKLRGEIGITGNSRVINGMALKVLGKSYNEENPAIIAEAGKLMLILAPNIRLIKDDNLQDDLLSGEVSVALMYTDHATKAMLANPDLKMVFPREGIGYGLMAAFVPAKAPNPVAAQAFLNYIMDARRGAACFENLGYYCTFIASEPFIGEAYRKYLTLPEGFNINMETLRLVNEAAEEEHERVWTAFRAATGN
ncbi:MAG: spermidine/putrescine ABC transporter substrate-binding protein [Treponema sp.]|jgi:spermidine/putrescine-binding protein|nr:spermidine/putrescine ABC transporter substrate-binding protein [Treponema sp.]